MSEDLDPELLQMLEEGPPEPAPSDDKLEVMIRAVAKLRDLRQKKLDQEEALKETNIRIRKAEMEVLPSMMDELRLPAITIGAEGNMPPYELSVGPYYHANIAAEWDDERRKAAFNYLEARGDGDLIKTEVTVIFNREDRAKAVEFAETMIDGGFNIKTKEAVAWGTLTSWLRDLIEKKGFFPSQEDLDRLGATVGRIVKLKAKDE